MTFNAQQSCHLSRPALICSLGGDLETISESLFRGRRGLVDDRSLMPDRVLPVGRVSTPLPEGATWSVRHRSRNNRLLAAALEQLMPTLDDFHQRHPGARIGTVIGTSTSGVGETEMRLAAYRRAGQWPADFAYQAQEIGSGARFIAEQLSLDGPAYTLSTACTSSAKALSSARRLLLSGACDAVIAGGADSLCGLTAHGFSTLEALSDAPCQPFSGSRDGINLGEGAALFLVTAEPGGIQLAGYGETSDAHHISAPHPEGKGAEAAMRAALKMAGLSPSQLDYLNLHGTATRQNDSMEAMAVNAVFGDDLPCSSTKALTGHTLGACGAIEAAFCWLVLEHGRLPPQVNDGKVDPDLAPLRHAVKEDRDCTHVLSNAFAFGGNNISLLLERTT